MKVKKEWKNKSGVYKINIERRCYIGSTVDLYMRLAQHISHLRSNKHHSKFMQRCFNKYGEELFQIEILEYCENNINILRTKELEYIIFYKSEFNSTTPIEFEHSEEMKTQISNTLKQKYKSGEIINPRLGKGHKINLYSFEGELLKENMLTEELVNYLNLSNRGVINTKLRTGNPIVKFKYLISLDNLEKDLYNWINKEQGTVIPLYQIFSDGKITKCSTSSKIKVIDKILNSKDYLYFSKKNNSYYTFIGNIVKCPFYKKL